MAKYRKRFPGGTPTLPGEEAEVVLYEYQGNDLCKAAERLPVAMFCSAKGEVTLFAVIESRPLGWMLPGGAIPLFAAGHPIADGNFFTKEDAESYLFGKYQKLTMLPPLGEKHFESR